jgi:hypothetical protein
MSFAEIGYKVRDVRVTRAENGKYWSLIIFEEKIKF